MDINLLVTPILSLGAVGLVFGGLLSFASTQFAVEEDPRIGQIDAILPGANCGGCGYPGCNNYATAVVGEIPWTNAPSEVRQLLQKLQISWA